MRANFLFTGLNLNRTIQSEKEVPERAHFMDDALKTRGIIYLNVETWLLFAPPPSKFLSTRLDLNEKKCKNVFN